MNTFELLEQLSKKSKNEIEYGLLALMMRGKIDFISVQQRYVQYLEQLKERNLCEKIEAETCVMESLMYGRKPKNEQEEISVQRRLYLLNKSKRFQMNRLNEKFNYNEKRAKTYNHVDDMLVR
jgi:hypothetical protein